MKTKKFIPVVAVVALFMSACTTNENSPGLEYMPDMYRSPAIEAYVDYGLDLAQDSIDWDYEKLEIARDQMSARKPVAGTVAHMGEGNEMYAMPYEYPDPIKDYEAAGAELKSPLKTTEENIEKGKAIYERMCLHCHGEQGKGDGKISEKIKGIPDYTTTLKDLPEGKMYHTIYHGKGVMGSHASQINVEERWLVIEYVKHLQRGGEMPSEEPMTEEPAAATGAVEVGNG